jgi:hypothetical protein
MNLKIKQLIWIDNISDDGKKQGLFEINSSVIHGSSYIIDFTIRNYTSGNGFEVKDKYFLWIKKGISREECIEFDNIDKAKERAQKEFKKQIMDLFFDGVDDEFILEDFLLSNQEVKSRGIECFGDLQLLERWLLSSTIYSKGYLKNRNGRVIDMPVGEILAEIGRIEHGVF